MNTFIAITRCLRFKLDSGEFSFKGCYRGHLIRGLILNAPPGVAWQKGEDYLLYVRCDVIEENYLKGVVLKAKLLSELYERD